MSVADLFELKGKTALVTGGGRGIGKHLATGLAEAGAQVFVASRKLDNCENAAAAIREAGGACEAVAADIAKPEAIDPLVDHVIERAGRVDVLVNNAGMVWSAPTLEYPLKGWDRVFDLNVRGLWLLTQRVAREMAERGGGSIIQVSSTSAFVGATEQEQPVVAYNASKGAVVALTTDLAVKLAPKGIRVNCIAPGPFATDMMGYLEEDPERLARFNAGVPLGRPGQEDDIKGVGVFLASEASRFMTGQTIKVDGGMTCLLRA